MKLFTKEIDNKLFKQYPMGTDLENQVVVAKIFNPYGRGTFYLLNSDENDPDYIWAIVDLFDVEMGSVSRSELEGLKFPPFNLGLERDLYFAPISAKALYEGLLKGQQFADGGETDTEILIAKDGQAWLFPENPDDKDFGIKLADGGELKADYPSHFVKHLFDKYKGKTYDGWNFMFDSLTGTISWLKNNLEIMATPFWDGHEILPIDMVNVENGDPLYQDTYEFKPQYNLERDEAKYFELLKPILMVLDVEVFEDGGELFDENGGYGNDDDRWFLIQNGMVLKGQLTKKAADALKAILSRKNPEKKYSVIWIEDYESDEKYADGGMSDNMQEMYKQIENRNMTIRFKIASVIGVDNALEYLEKDYVVSPFRLIEGAVSKGLINIDDINDNLWNEAVLEAEDVDNTYRDSGEGIGGSDMNAFISNMLNSAGIKVGVVDNRYKRMANGGETEQKYVRYYKTPQDKATIIGEYRNFKSAERAQEMAYKKGELDALTDEHGKGTIVGVMPKDKFEKGDWYADGGMTKKKTTFDDKVKAISKRLEGSKVKAKYKSKYGATYNKAESKEAAKSIVGSIRAKYGK